MWCQQKSPLVHLPSLWSLDSDYLVTVQDTQWIKGLLKLSGTLVMNLAKLKQYTHLSHCINGGFARLMGQIVPFDKTHAVFTGNGAFHIDRSLDHTMDNVLSYFALFFVEKENG